jgi:3-hydroxyacyl-CoA dehydrogenase
MGSGIAIALLEAGHAVTVVEADEGVLARGRARIEAAKRATLSGRLSCTQELAALADSDLVIEAVFEDMTVKSELFRRLGGIVRGGAVLATNTSYLDVATLAATSGRPQDVLGLHFFAPANVMRLLEVVRTDEMSPEVLATGLALGRRLGKLAVVAGNGEGFISNRI